MAITEADKGMAKNYNLYYLPDLISFWSAFKNQGLQMAYEMEYRQRMQKGIFEYTDDMILVNSLNTSITRGESSLNDLRGFVSNLAGVKYSVIAIGEEEEYDSILEQAQDLAEKSSLQTNKKTLEGFLSAYKAKEIKPGIFLISHIDVR